MDIFFVSLSKTLLIHFCLLPVYCHHSIRWHNNHIAQAKHALENYSGLPSDWDLHIFNIEPKKVHTVLKYFGISSITGFFHNLLFQPLNNQLSTIPSLVASWTYSGQSERDTLSFSPHDYANATSNLHNLLWIHFLFECFLTCKRHAQYRCLIPQLGFELKPIKSKYLRLWTSQDLIQWISEESKTGIFCRWVGSDY